MCGCARAHLNIRTNCAAGRLVRFFSSISINYERSLSTEKVSGRPPSLHASLRLRLSSPSALPRPAAARGRGPPRSPRLSQSLPGRRGAAGGAPRARASFIKNLLRGPEMRLATCERSDSARAWARVRALSIVDKLITEIDVTLTSFLLESYFIVGRERLSPWRLQGAMW